MVHPKWRPLSSVTARWIGWVHSLLSLCFSVLICKPKTIGYSESGRAGNFGNPIQSTDLCCLGAVFLPCAWFLWHYIIYLWCYRTWMLKEMLKLISALWFPPHHRWCGRYLLVICGQDPESPRRDLVYFQFSSSPSSYLREKVSVCYLNIS